MQLQKFDQDECKDKFKENKKAFSKASEKYYSSMSSGLLFIQINKQIPACLYCGSVGKY